VSHIPQRKEKDCLNCGTIVQGKYCHTCGQENVEPKETFWHMFTHFFYDITHFDSNFFTTVKDLLFKPGFLSKEYMLGRRAMYLHPIRMYVFTSAIFFLLFFTFFGPKDNFIEDNPNQPATSSQREAYINALESKLAKDTGNAVLKQKYLQAKDTNYKLLAKDIVVNAADSIVRKNRIHVNFTSKDFKSFEEYDSLEKALPPSKRDGWVMRRIVKKAIEISNKYRDNPDEALKKFTESILHRLPYMLLVSLPFFALILKLVYIRRKQFYYADHGVFTIHLYVFTFLMLLLIFTLQALQDKFHLRFIGVITTILILCLLFYLYKAMRTFYSQGRWKTFFKFFIVSLSSLLMMVILLILFMFFSAATL
jgi:hypothetical protein